MRSNECLVYLYIYVYLFIYAVYNVIYRNMKINLTNLLNDLNVLRLSISLYILCIFVVRWYTYMYIVGRCMHLCTPHIWTSSSGRATKQTAHQVYCTFISTYVTTSFLHILFTWCMYTTRKYTQIYMDDGVCWMR